MKSKRILELLLEEAQLAKESTEKLLLVAEEKYGLCSDEFQTMMKLRGELDSEVVSLKEGIKQVEMFNRLSRETDNEQR